MGTAAGVSKHYFQENQPAIRCCPAPRPSSGWLSPRRKPSEKTLIDCRRCEQENNSGKISAGADPITLNVSAAAQANLPRSELAKRRFRRFPCRWSPRWSANLAHKRTKEGKRTIDSWRAVRMIDAAFRKTACLTLGRDRGVSGDP
jgi:hypothetical protein